MSTTSVSDASYNALLRQSKVLRLSSQRPVAVTAPASYRHRDDFGLKHALPSRTKRSPFLYVRSLDAASGIGSTDFRPATADALLVQKLHAVGATVRPHAAHPISYPAALRSMGPLMTTAKTAEGVARWAEADQVARKRDERGPPDVQALSDEAFAALLDLIRDPASGLREQFRQFCASEAAADVETARAEGRSTAELNMATRRAELVEDEQFPFQTLNEPAAFQRWTTSFLAQPAVLDALERAQIIEPVDALPSQLHPTLGLTYSLPSSFHATVEAAPVRARALDTAEERSQAVVLGMVADDTGKLTRKFYFDNADADVNQSREAKATQGLADFRFAALQVSPPDAGPNDRDVRSSAQEPAPFETNIAQLADAGLLPARSPSAQALRRLPRTVPEHGVQARVYAINDEARERDRVPIGTPAYVVHGGILNRTRSRSARERLDEERRAAARAAAALTPGGAHTPRKSLAAAGDFGGGFIKQMREAREAREREARAARATQAREGSGDGNGARDLADTDDWGGSERL